MVVVVVSGCGCKWSAVVVMSRWYAMASGGSDGGCSGEWLWLLMVCGGGDESVVCHGEWW
jgi:hypothetical protein